MDIYQFIWYALSMKKLIVGLVLVGLLFAPNAKAQVDETAILAQLRIIYDQLIVLYAQLSAQIAEQSNQITNLQNMAKPKIVESEPVPVSEPTPVIVNKEIKIKAKESIVFGQENAIVVVQVLHDGSAKPNIPFSVKSSDPMDINRLNNKTFRTNSSDPSVVIGPFGDFTFDPSSVGTFTFEITAEGISETISIEAT